MQHMQHMQHPTRPVPVTGAGQVVAPRESPAALPLSGSTWAAVLEQRPELRFPADVYLEGSDQHRGWFNSSLMVAVGARGAAPYRTGSPGSGCSTSGSAVARWTRRDAPYESGRPSSDACCPQ